MKTILATMLLLAAQASFAGEPIISAKKGVDISVIQTVLMSKDVQKSLAATDITEISASATEKGDVTAYEVVISGNEAGLNFPDGKPTTHPATVIVTYQSGIGPGGQLVSTKPVVRELKAMNSPMGFGFGK